MACLVALTLSACSGSAPGASDTPKAKPSATPTVITLDASGPAHVITTSDASPRPGIDLRMPGWVRPAKNSGLYSEKPDDANHVVVASIDVSWKQLSETKGVLNEDETGSAQGMSFESLKSQLAEQRPFWMRVFASGETWAPSWVATQCHVKTYGPDYDGMSHLPIWNDCVWNALLDTYRQLFVDRKLREDPRLQFVYVPGAFTWAEFDNETISKAVKAGDLTQEQYEKWYGHAWSDLVAIFGPYSNKLVFTGEDYTWNSFTADQRRLAAKKAVDAGLGIRNGIPEGFNFHLNEAPAYGSHIGPDGHLSVDETLPIHSGRFVVGMENECFNACGFNTDDPEYAVTQTNLKSLQLRANWVYVTDHSYLEQYAEQWDWLRLSLGQTAATSPDAWANLREASDEYWRDNDEAPFDTKAAWPNKPWVRNLERWVVQRDVPGGIAHVSDVDVRTHVFNDENGTAHEGLSTRLASGDKGLYFDVDDTFAKTTSGDVIVNVTAWGAGGGFTLRAGDVTLEAPKLSGKPGWETVSVTVPAAAFTAALPGHTDFAVLASQRDTIVRFVRVIRLNQPVQPT